jgi:hypothetical protein
MTARTIRRVSVDSENIARGTDFGKAPPAVPSETSPGDDVKRAGEGNSLAHYNLALAHQAQGSIVNAIREYQRP